MRIITNNHLEVVISISNVIESWSNGEPMKSGSVSTDGTHLFSYNLCIGKRTKRSLNVYDYRKSSGNYISGKATGSMRIYDNIYSPSAKSELMCTDIKIDDFDLKV